MKTVLMVRVLALSAGLASTVVSTGVANALEIGAIGKKLILKTNNVSGKQKAVSLQLSPSIDPGAPGDPAMVSGSLEIFYVDSPGNAGLLPMPQPWDSATASKFSYKNTLAPGGPSQVKIAKVKPNKMVKVVSKGIGALDISTPPGSGGVIAVFTLSNGNDSSELKVCTRYSTGDGSTVEHTPTGNGFKLKLKNGVGVTCSPVAPTCSDGIPNQGETDIDCGGPCPPCGFGGGCSVNGDCQSGLACAGGLCKCANHLFTFTVNSNSGGAFDSAEWPGGSDVQNTDINCAVQVNLPNDNIDLVCALAAPFSVNGWIGFSNCFGTGGEDGDGCQVNSCPPLGIGSCCMTRPSCSAALNGSGQAQYSVQCLQ